MGIPKDKLQVGDTVSVGVSGPTPKPDMNELMGRTQKSTCSKYALGTECGMVDVSIPKALEKKFVTQYGWNLHEAIEQLIQNGPYSFQD